jgi:hypothetical protein
MSSTSTSGQQFDPVTGEILDEETHRADLLAPLIEPSVVATSTDLARLPENLSDLAAFFAEPEPSPKEVIQWIAGTAEMDETDPEQTTRSIMARILSETTATGILSGHKVTHADQVLGAALEATAVKWQRSTVDGGSSCYAVITAHMIDTEETITLTCGGRNVMTQLLAFQVHQLLPVRCRIMRAAKPTEAGFYPLWLEPA